jgi:hypothetical protein
MYQLNQIPSESQIRKYLRRIVFGKNLFCPVCRSRKIVRYEKSSNDWIIKPKTQLTIYKIIFIIIIISYLTQVLSKEIAWLLLWLEAITACFHFGIYYVAFINKDTSSPSHTK